MERNEYPSNANKDKMKEKKVERVVTGRVTTRKQPLGRRMASIFLGEDTSSVSQYVMFDVVVPALKSMVSDVFSEGVERLLFGDVRRSRAGAFRSGPASRSSYTSYSSVSRSTDRRPSDSDPRSRRTHDFSEHVFEVRGDAEEVLDRMIEMIEQYGIVTVADFYELVGVSGTYTDDRYGWRDLRGSEVRRIKEGYIVDLPRARDLG